jgi:hypothetical protein
MTTAADNHGTLRAVLATVGMAVLLAPLAQARYGLGGVSLVAMFAVAVVASLVIASRGAAALERRNHLLAGLFVASGVRMILPLGVATAIVFTQGRIAPVNAVVLVVPIYLTMLAADLYQWVRRGPQLVSARRDQATISGGVR